MKNPFEDFPRKSDWFVGEKALEWRDKHEKEILDLIKKCESAIKLIKILVEEE